MKWKINYNNTNTDLVLQIVAANTRCQDNKSTAYVRAIISRFTEWNEIKHEIKHTPVTQGFHLNIFFTANQYCNVILKRQQTHLAEEEFSFKSCLRASSLRKLFLSSPERTIYHKHKTD